jgi:vacuolar protein sorting-associated protein 54
MNERLNSHIKAFKVNFHRMFNIRRVAMLLFLQTVDWTVPKPGGGVNEYMEILVKETTTLHKVLSRYLALSVVEVRRFISFLLPGKSCGLFN